MSRRSDLTREIVLALAIKTLLLFGLWWIFFADKPDRQTVASEVAKLYDRAGGPGTNPIHANKELTP